MAQARDGLPYSVLSGSDAERADRGAGCTSAAAAQWNLRRTPLYFLTSAGLLAMGMLAGTHLERQQTAAPTELLGLWAPGMPGLWEGGTYETWMEFHMPYYDFVEDVYVHAEEKQGLMRLSYYSGANTFLLNTSGLGFQVIPVDDHLECLYTENAKHLENVVPDLKTFMTMGTYREVDLIDKNGFYSVGFEFMLNTGPPTDHNHGKDTWTFFDHHTKAAYAGTFKLIINATAGGAPVNLTFVGHNGFLVPSHFDTYHIIYKTFYKRSSIDVALFFPPRGMPCTAFANVHGPIAKGAHSRTFAALRDLALAIPSDLSKDGFAEFGEELHVHLQQHNDTGSALSMRRQVALNNFRYIQAANRRGLPYTLAANHMITWLPHEKKRLNGAGISAERVAPMTMVQKRVNDHCGKLTGHYEAYTDAKGEPSIKRLLVLGNHLKDHQEMEFNKFMLEGEQKPLPDSLDLRGSGLVGPVKDQGTCGSCWAFGAVGALEGQYAKMTGSFVMVGEQQLVDCTWTAGCKGCDGCEIHKAYSWLMQENNGKFQSANQYGPYLSQDGFCHLHKVPGSITAMVAIKPAPEKYNSAISLNACSHIRAKVQNPALWEKAQIDMLAFILQTHGPVGVSITSSDDDFYYYASGVYNDPKCSTTDLDHIVGLVGYGVDKQHGISYWLIRNSWSTHWGEGGYMRIAQKGNVCGVLSEPVIPHLVEN